MTFAIELRPCALLRRARAGEHVTECSRPNVLQNVFRCLGGRGWMPSPCTDISVTHACEKVHCWCWNEQHMMCKQGPSAGLIRSSRFLWSTGRKWLRTSRAALPCLCLDSSFAGRLCACGGWRGSRRKGENKRKKGAALRSDTGAGAACVTLA